jgi:hypothetical protein
VTTRRATLAALATLLGAALDGSLGAQPATGLRAGVVVSPDTVSVGDPFVVRVRVQAPAGSAVTFPAPPDTTGPVQALDPRRVDTVRSATGEVDVVATYRVAAWDVDSQPLGLGDVVVRVNGADRRVPLAAYRVYVRSVLPTDSTLRVPKPQRPPVADGPSLLVQWWPWIVAALVVIALVSWLVARWLKRRGARRPQDDPYGRAVAELDRLERLGLIEAGEPGRLVALAADVVRDFLAARLPAAAPSLTSTEVLSALQDRDEVPHERLDSFLTFADLVKFAALRIAADAARRAFADARGVVDDVERGVKEREAREAAEAAERERRERDEARQYDAARRRAAARRDAA